MFSSLSPYLLYFIDAVYHNLKACGLLDEYYEQRSFRRGIPGEEWIPGLREC